MKQRVLQERGPTFGFLCLFQRTRQIGNKHQDCENEADSLRSASGLISKAVWIFLSLLSAGVVTLAGTVLVGIGFDLPESIPWKHLFHRDPALVCCRIIEKSGCTDFSWKYGGDWVHQFGAIRYGLVSFAFLSQWAFPFCCIWVWDGEVFCVKNGLEKRKEKAAGFGRFGSHLPKGFPNLATSSQVEISYWLIK